MPAKLGFAAIKRLTTEFMKLVDDPVPGALARPLSKDDFSVWEFAIEGPEDSAYAYGVFTGTLTFPEDYPLAPPKMVFSPPITHPNVFGGRKAGEVCISILHTGVDVTGYERADERWSPAQTIRSMLLSVSLMLKEVNVESPANVDAGKLYSQQPELFRKIVKGEVERSLGLPASASIIHTT